MKKISLICVVVIFILIGICVPIYAPVVQAEPEAEPVGLLGMGEDDAWVVIKSDGISEFELEYIGFGCHQVVKGDCVSGLSLPAPKVGTHYTLTGNQKWQNGKTQDIRHRETLIQKCFAYLAKLKKCPPCPVCDPEQATTCSPDGCR